MRKQTFCMAIAALTVAAVTAGCNGGSHINQDARVSLKNATIVFIPLRGKNAYYYDYAPGVAIAANAAVALEKNTQHLRAASARPATGLVRATIMNDEITNADWAAAGEAAGADYVVYGAVDEISWRDRSDPSLPRCNFAITYSVVEAARARLIYHRSLDASYPVRLISDEGISVFEMSGDEFMARAYKYIGEVIARTFYKHEISNFEQHNFNEHATSGPR